MYRYEYCWDMKEVVAFMNAIRKSGCTEIALHAEPSRGGGSCGDRIVTYWDPNE